MRVALFFFGVALLGFIGVIATHGGNAPPAASQRTDMATEKQTILSYRACEGGTTLDRATAQTLQLAGVQSVSAIRYVSHDEKLAKYEIPYKAANGAEKAVAFNLSYATGTVNAENDDGLAVLMLMKAGCR